MAAVISLRLVIQSSHRHEVRHWSLTAYPEMKAAIDDENLDRDARKKPCAGATQRGGATGRAGDA